MSWYGNLPSPEQLHMLETDCGLYYGLLGIICAWSLIHHIRSF